MERRFEGDSSAGPSLPFFRSISMTKLTFLAFSLSTWFSGAWLELCQYFNNMSTTQWGVIAAASVAFGFLCLRGNSLRH